VAIFVRRSTLLLALLALAGGARPAAAQAWTPRAGQAGLTFATQMIDHVGRMLDDGTRLSGDACSCGSTNVTVFAQFDYGFTNRLSVSASIPYGFAKYRGVSPAEVGLPWLPYAPADACHCVNSSFQDFGFTAHYNLYRAGQSSSVTTEISYGTPSHAYDYVGEAVVGFGLNELGLGLDAGQRLDRLLPGLSIEGDYLYSFVQRALNIRHDRSNIQLEPSVDIGSRWSSEVILSWQVTHGGLRMPADVEPYPERYMEFHRLLQDNYFHAGAGVSYRWGDWNLSGEFLRTVSGTNSHDVHVYSLTAGRAFRLRR
jgi:hypothetical protein